MNRKQEFEKFYRRHFDKVYRWVFFRVGANHELAEDLAAEIFTKALNAFDRYDPAVSSSSWILTIARNHVANYYRDRKPADPVPDDLLVEDETALPGWRWVRKALEQWAKTQAEFQAQELLAALSDDEREIVTFHYLLGYSYSEIGHMRGASETAVKVAAHRAIKKMRQLL